MAQNEPLPQLDPHDFTLTETGALSITMPAPPTIDERDIDAQLFSYVIEAEKGEHIRSVADLDDAWVQKNFPDMNTIDDLRDLIRAELSKTNTLDYDNVKFQRCADVLVGRLKGEIPDDVKRAYAKAARAEYAQRLAMAGMSKQTYMQDHNISESEFENRLFEDVVFQLRLNIALDIMADARGVTIADEDLTKYLQVPNEDTFLDEARATNKLEEARQAAARVKVMRDLIEEAQVEEAKN